MTTESFHRNVERVVSAGRELGIDVRPVRFPDGAKTAADAAAAVGCDVGQIVKSLVFAVDDEPVVALVSGPNRLDEDKLAAAAGGASCTRIDADRVRAVTAFPIGGIPPFGYPQPIRTFFDAALLAFDEVWAAAGTWHDVFPVSPSVLRDVTDAVVADIVVTP